MSLIYALILSSAAGSPPPPDPQSWQRVARAAHDMGVPTPHLFDALTTADSPRRAARPIYCFDDQLTALALPIRRCRTREEWRAFGLEPILAGSDAG